MQNIRQTNDKDAAAAYTGLRPTGRCTLIKRGTLIKPSSNMLQIRTRRLGKFNCSAEYPSGKNSSSMYVRN